MPLVSPSSYHEPPWPLRCRHVQTILPSYCRRGEDVHYQRETFPTPDGDEFWLDWSRVGSDRLVIISHGLCGHTHRHYVLSLVKAFNAAGWDCLAWNYRVTGDSPGKILKFTTNNSTDELSWVTTHAIKKGGYRQVFLSGYSMGGNLTTLYFTRDGETLPPQVVGGVVFCATTDLVSCNESLNNFMGRVYARHFVKKLVRKLRARAELLPPEISLEGAEKFNTFPQFDNRFTAPLCGFKDAHDYYVTASACRYYDKLKVPLLMVQPRNDPFLKGDCFPVEEARRSSLLYLEMPRGGGHCGFITPGDGLWWPASRAIEFMRQIAG